MTEDTGPQGSDCFVVRKASDRLNTIGLSAYVEKWVETATLPKNQAALAARCFGTGA